MQVKYFRHISHRNCGMNFSRNGRRAVRTVGHEVNMTTIREDLGHYLQRHQHSHDELEQLLTALERKDAELQRQLETEQEPQKRRHLEIELEVTRLQHSKGIELRDARR